MPTDGGLMSPQPLTLAEINAHRKRAGLKPLRKNPYWDEKIPPKY